MADRRSGRARVAAVTDTEAPMVAQDQLIYIEHKSGYGDAGPAWITRARVSKGKLSKDAD